MDVATSPPPVPAPEGATGTRERIVGAASRLLQQQGYAGTGIKQIAGEAGATLSSVYHFFPGGKEELAAEAIRLIDREFVAMFRPTLDAEPDPAEAVIACTRLLAAALSQAGWVGGCRVTAIALETVGRTPVIAAVIAEAFTQWQALVSDKLRLAGMAEADARALAGTVLAAVEGAALAAQVFHSEEPLLAAGRHLARLIDSYR